MCAHSSPTSPVFFMRYINHTPIMWFYQCPSHQRQVVSQCWSWHEELGQGGTGECSLGSERSANARHYDVNNLLQQRLRPARPGHTPRQQSPNRHRGGPSIGPPSHWVPEAESQQRTAHQGGEAVAEGTATAQDGHHHNGMPMCTMLHSLQSSVPREASFHPQGHQEGWELASPSHPGNRRPADIKGQAQDVENGRSKG